MQGHERRAKVAEWLETTRMYRPVGGAASKWRGENARAGNERAIEDFTKGKKRDRLMVMGPDDNR